MLQSEDIGWLNGFKKKKQDISICSLQETDFRPKDMKTQSEGMEKHANGSKKKAGVAIIIYL